VEEGLEIDPGVGDSQRETGSPRSEASINARIQDRILGPNCTRWPASGAQYLARMRGAASSTETSAMTTSQACMMNHTYLP
jgi:hypothetical protein